MTTGAPRITGYVIEVEDMAVGLAVAEGAGAEGDAAPVVFHASHPAAQSLHLRSFSDPTAAARAVRRAMRRAA